MKIAFLNYYCGLIDRGAETFVKELAVRLSRTHQVWVFQAGEASGKERYKTVCLKTKWSKWGRITVFSFQALPILLKEKFHWLIPVNGGLQTVISKIVSKKTGSKILISGQASCCGHDDFWNLQWSPDVYIGLSKKAVNWAKKINKKTKCIYIPNAVDLKKFTPPGGKLTLDLEKPVVLCVCAFDKWKRIDLVIKAVAKLKKGSLLIVGDGSQKKELTDLGTRLLGRQRFKIIQKPYEKMPLVYRSADLFTLASKPTEAFGIVYLEAMASGLPVVAPADELRKEIIGNAGLFCNVVNIDEYRKTLEEALKTYFGNRPREQAEKFSWDKIANDYERILKSK